jgi:hypothetical protein
MNDLNRQTGQANPYFVFLTKKQRFGQPLIRSHLKKVFSAVIGVEPSSQVLDILEYACGLILGLALISIKNPIFEMASSR